MVGGDAEKVARSDSRPGWDDQAAESWPGRRAGGPGCGIFRRSGEYGGGSAAIDRAVRELASLVLCRGMSPAAEVFAREIRDLIDREELLQREAMAARSAAESGESQTVVAKRLSRLLTDVAALPDTQTDALAAVRIIRTRKLIEAGRAVAAMESAGRRSWPAGRGRGGPQPNPALAVLREAEVRLREIPGSSRWSAPATCSKRRSPARGGSATRSACSLRRNSRSSAWCGNAASGPSALPLSQIDSGLGVNEQVRAAAKAAADAAQGLAAGERAGDRGRAGTTRDRDGTTARKSSKADCRRAGTLDGLSPPPGGHQPSKASSGHR